MSATADVVAGARPVRVVLSRKRGWRMPANTVKVDRSTRWGNPFKVGEMAIQEVTGELWLVMCAEDAVLNFRAWLRTVKAGQEMARDAKRLLVGKNLACWCKEGQACHAAVLLELVNGTGGAA